MVLNVRSGQYLRINIVAKDEENAKDIIMNMCNDLRIFNPVTQNLTILSVKKL
jgi:phosphoribosylformylglycinamidine (FGAM) synthase PurS component